MKYNLLSLLLGASLFVAMLMASCGRAVPSDNDTNIAPAEVYDDSTVIIVSEDAPPTISEIGDNVDQTVHRQAIAAGHAVASRQAVGAHAERQTAPKPVVTPADTVVARIPADSDTLSADTLPSDNLPADTLPAVN